MGGAFPPVITHRRGNDRCSSSSSLLEHPGFGVAMIRTVTLEAIRYNTTLSQKMYITWAYLDITRPKVL